MSRQHTIPLADIKRLGVGQTAKSPVFFQLFVRRP